MSRLLCGWTLFACVLSHTSSFSLYESNIGLSVALLKLTKRKGKSTCYFWHSVLTSAVCWQTCFWDKFPLKYADKAPKCTSLWSQMYVCLKSYLQTTFHIAIKWALNENLPLFRLNKLIPHPNQHMFHNSTNLIWI